MLRGFALTVGLLAVLPAAAGEMNADEARRFVIGKMFSYTCFEGTRGQGRVNSDGSVAGSVQFQGAGPALRPSAGEHAVRSKARPYAPAARTDLPACFNLERVSDTQLPAARSRVSGFALLRIYAQRRPAEPQRVQRASNTHPLGFRPSLTADMQ